MSKPARVRLSRAKGFYLQAHSQALNGLPAVKCDRTTHFGNPWVVGDKIDLTVARRWGWTFSPQGRHIICDSPFEAAARFERALIWDGAIHDHVRKQLGGKNLGCWCPLDAPCHCVGLLFVANSTREQINRLHALQDAQIGAAVAEIMRAEG